MTDLPAFEFIFAAEDGTPLQIGVVEAESLIDAIQEVGKIENPDADAVSFTVREIGE